MYHEELEQLIEFALIDGTITDKERAVLVNKALQLGINKDEFEMVLEARIHQMNKGQSSANSFSNEEKKNDTLRCASCNAITTSFTSNCSYCGAEFRNSSTPKSLQNFLEGLDQIESQRTTSNFGLSSKFDGNIGTLFKWWFFWWILLPMKVFHLMGSQLTANFWSTIDSRKEEFILNFHVPNSREEIIEFTTLFLSKIQYISVFKSISLEGKYIQRWNTVWGNKTNQLYMKAKLSLKDDQETIKYLESLMIEKGLKK